MSLIASVTGHSGGDTNSFTTSGIDTTGATLLVACFATDISTFTLSDNKGNTWTSAIDNDAAEDSRIWYAWNPTVGTAHTFTLTGTGIFGSMQVYAHDGVDATADPINGTNSDLGFGVTTKQPGSVTPSANGALIVTHLTHDTASTPTIDASFTSPAGAGTGYGDQKGAFGFLGSHSAYLVQVTAGAVNPTWTSASGNKYATIAAFKATVPVPSAALTGTVTTANEADIVAGGKTIVLTLTNETFISN